MDPQISATSQALTDALRYEAEREREMRRLFIAEQTERTS